jgi:sugar lactone lactonase YvrE
MKHLTQLFAIFVLSSLLLAGCAQAATAVPSTQSAPATAAATATLAATPMPAPTAGPPPTAAPTATAAGAASLVGHYLMPGPINWLDLSPDGHDYRPDGYGTYTVSGNQMTFVDARDCAEPGVYQWSLQADTLRFDKVEEPCATRGQSLLGNLTRLPALPYVQPEWLTHDQAFSSTAVDAQGNTYAASGDAKTITKYSPAGKLLATLGGPGTEDGQFVSMGGAAVDGQGNLYVADLGGVHIEKFDASGKYLTSFKPQAEPGPLGVAVDKQGNVYVALHGLQDHYVEKWSPDGKLLATWGNTGSGDGQFTATDQDSGPRGIAVGAQGHVYVTDPDANRVQEFDGDGKFLRSLTGNGDHQFLYPFSLGVDPGGTLYVQNDDGELFAFDATGKPAGLWRAPAGASVRFDAAGDLFMLIGGDIAKITLPQP